MKQMKSLISEALYLEEVESLKLVDKIVARINSFDLSDGLRKKLLTRLKILRDDKAEHGVVINNDLLPLVNKK